MSEDGSVGETPEHSDATTAPVVIAPAHAMPAARRARVPAIGKGWFEQAANVNKIVWALVAVCVASVAADLFYHKHGHYGFQEWIGFDAIYGFVSCVLLVLAAKQLRKVLMRDEDYYD